MKLQYLIDNILSSEIQALSFVDRYGGVVQTMHTEIDNGTENPTIKRYPIACDVVGKDCNDTSFYHHLVPDDSKDSVVYWEIIQPMQNIGATPAKDYHTRKFRGVARLVVWMNIAKLGGSDCKTPFFAVPPLEKILSKKLKMISGEYSGSQLRIQPKGMAPNSIKSIFGKYDYPKLNSYALYPYGFFAIDVAFELDQCLAKGGTFPINPPIDCPNDTGITVCQDIVASMSDSTKCCVLKSYDFSLGYDTDYNCLTQAQKDDLAARSPIPPPSYQNNYSMYFDGTGEVINYPINASYDLEYTDSFTFTARIKIDSWHLGAILGKYVNNGFGWFWRVSTNGRLQIFFGRGSSQRMWVETTNTLTIGQTYHVAMCFGGAGASSVDQYLNAVLETPIPLQDNITGSIINGNNLVSGSIVGGNYFHGTQNVVRIWKGIKFNQSQVTADYNGNIPTDSGEVGFLVLDNRMGDGAVFGVDDWCLPDGSGTVTGGQSAFMEFDSRVAAI